MQLNRSSILLFSVIDLSRSHPYFHISIFDGPYNDLLYRLRYLDLELRIRSIGRFNHITNQQCIIVELL